MMDYIILWISCVIEVYLMVDFFDTFFEKRSYIKSNAEVVFISMIVCGTLYVTNILGNEYINLCVAPLILWGGLFFLFQGRIGKKILYFMMYYFILIGCECIFAVWIHAERSAYHNMSEIPHVIIMVFMLSYIILLILKRLLSKRQSAVQSKIFLLYLLMPLTSFGMMTGVFFSGVINMEEDWHRGSVMFCYFLLLTGNVAVLKAFDLYSEQLNRQAEDKIQLRMQESELQKYKNMVDRENQYEEMVHDLRHYIKTIDFLLEEEKYKEIREYSKTTKEKMREQIIVLWTDNPLLNAIISDYKNKAKACGVKFDAIVEPGIKWEHFEEQDMVAMTGNLLENALKATVLCEEKYVRLRIYMQNEGNLCVVKIVNSCMEKEYSTKDNYGIGLRSVNVKAEKYGGMLSTECRANTYTAVLILSML